MRKAVLLITSVLLLNTSFACLNEYHISRRGVSSIDHFAMDDIYFVKDFDKTELEKDLAKLIADSAVNKRSLSYYKNNIAVKLIKLGRNDEAMAILEELYRSNPREYNIVVNLGTLYELLGQNQRALEFIKNAVSLYPGSHHGSEWFHVKVLEYKLKNRKEDQVPGDDILDIRNVKKEISQMAMGVAHQFKERIPFTPVPNLMMAKLLMEYGD